MKNFLISIFLAALTMSAQANSIREWFKLYGNPYVSASVGYGDSRVSNMRPLHYTVTADYDFDSLVYSLGAGYRMGMFAAEVGLMRMPTFKGSVDIPDYPAYKGCTPGPTCENDAKGTSRIDAKALYLRGNVYAPKVLGLEPYGFAGVARSLVRSEEHSTYNGGTSSADLIDRYSVWTGVYGLGVQTAGKLAMRAEFTYVPRFADGLHTLKREAAILTLGAVYSF